MNNKTLPVPLPNCPICGMGADKTNSHLIPWFIIKNCITEDGSGTNDKEISYTISSRAFTKRFTGRSILPEKLDNLEELDILQQEETNPYSSNYLLCSNCEAKLSRLESIFANQFAEKKINYALSKLQKQNSQSIYIDEKYDFGLYQLLIQSIFYRCSIGLLDGFRLHHEIESKIAMNLRKIFAQPDFKKLTNKNRITLLHNFPLVTSILYTPDRGDPTKNFVMINRSRYPYFLMAGKWIFQLWEKEKQINGTSAWLYGLRRELNIGKLYPIINGKAHAVILTNKSSEYVLQQRLYFFINKKIIGLEKEISDFYLYFFKKRPGKEVVQFIKARYFYHLVYWQFNLETLYIFVLLKSVQDANTNKVKQKRVALSRITKATSQFECAEV